MMSRSKPPSAANRLSLVKLKRAIAPFDFEDKQVLTGILKLVDAVLLIASIPSIIQFVSEPRPLYGQGIGIAAADLILVLLLWDVFHQRLTLARYLIPILTLGVVVYLNYQGDGIRDVTVMDHAFVMVLAGLLIGKNAPLIFAALSSLALYWIYVLEMQGIVITEAKGYTEDLIGLIIILFITAGLIRITIGTLQNSLRRVRLNEQILEAQNVKLIAAQEENRQLLSDLQATVQELQIAKRIAEDNSRLKSEFLSTMSHEIRTPMNAIEGFTGVILNGMGGTSQNDKTRRYVERIQVNSKRLLALINDFLDLSRIEAGRFDLASAPFSPGQLAQTWYDQMSDLIEAKKLAFDLDIDPALLNVICYGDEESISKVAINLLGNALKFTEKGRVQLAVWRAEDTWQIVVTDTGIGIPPHAREIIFEEFRQADQSSQRKYGGSGLGLAIVQKLVRLMGGAIQLKSEVNQGSTFTVTLPLQTTATVPASMDIPSAALSARN